ncbi:MAG: hypothetical protein IT560_09875 [Alphaproteobacteria bacterium]|nr:hypothetical protein [Alphaproteobacteria bacterium]
MNWRAFTSKIVLSAVLLMMLIAQVAIAAHYPAHLKEQAQSEQLGDDCPVAFAAHSLGLVAVAVFVALQFARADFGGALPAQFRIFSAKNSFHARAPPAYS